MMWYEYVLREAMVRRIIFSLLSIVLAVFLWVYLWNKNKRDKYSYSFLINRVLAVLICRILPIIIVLSTFKMTAKLFIYYYNMEENQQCVTVTVTGATRPGRTAIDILQECSIVGNGNHFRVPKKVYTFSDIERGKTYTLYYFKHSHIVYSMYEAD